MVCFYLIQRVKNEEILFEFNLIKGRRGTNVNVKSTEINHFDRSVMGTLVVVYNALCMFRQAIKVNLNEIYCAAKSWPLTLHDSVVWLLFIIRRLIQLHKI